MQYLSFESEIAEIEKKIEELRKLVDKNDLDAVKEIKKLQEKVSNQYTQIYSKLSPWQKVQVARHPDRPHGAEIINKLISDFQILRGDRNYGEDVAIYGGIGRFHNQSVMVIANERGHDTESRILHNFGMARPEGYRKVVRLMRLAERFNIPILTFIDTPGADPAVPSEERGQAEAIAQALNTCLEIEVPLIATVIGEGGSGGAIALAAGDVTLMLTNAVYSVISPEGCASILWRDAKFSKDAADILHITATDLKKLGIIDDVITEPAGGAHRHRETMFGLINETVAKHLKRLSSAKGSNLSKKRRQRFLEMQNLNFY